MAFDAAGNLYIAGGTVRKASTTDPISPVAGKGNVSAGYAGDGGPAALCVESTALAVRAPTSDPGVV